MAANRETVLYYTPEKNEKVRKIKSVLVRLGIRIKNIAPEQIHERVGTLVGLEGVGPAQAAEETEDTGAQTEACTMRIPEEMLVMYNFSETRLDRLLRELRKSGASVSLKAVVTETNCMWTFYELYREIHREHVYMTEKMKRQQ